MCRRRLIFLTLIVGYGLLSSAYGFDCPGQLQPNCRCTTIVDDIAFECETSKYDESRIIRVNNARDNHTAIYCTSEQSTMTMNEVIPQLELGVQEYVKIDLTCPLGADATVKNYFDRLGVTAVTDLLLFGSIPSKLTKEIFAGASNTVHLNLYYNKIESLPSDVFEHLTSLATIELSQNAFSSLPEPLFSKNKKLKSVTLTRNENVLPLPTGLLSNLPVFETANFENAQISSVTADLFAESTNIKSISFATNILHTIPELLFSSQTRLENLRLDRNSLRVIPANLFKNNAELQILNLSENRVASLPATLFENNKKLRKIDLSVNAIKIIPDSLLSSLEQLEELDLHYNQIQRLTNDMLPAHITSLNLYHNQLEVIDPNFLTRFDNGLYNHFSFSDNPMISLHLTLYLRRSKPFTFIDIYRCGNVAKFVVDVISECKS